MGLWQFLNRPLNAGPNDLWWREPRCFWLRLRGDALQRLMLVAGCVGIGAGVGTGFCLLYEPSSHHLLGGWAVGAALACAVGFFLFAGPDGFRGLILARDTNIRCERSGTSWTALFTGLSVEFRWQEWPYSAIRQCVIVPRHSLGKSFSVLIISTDESIDVLGVSRRIDPRALTAHLVERGVRVSLADTVPRKLRSPAYSGRLVAGVFIVGMALLLGSLFVGAAQPGQNPPQLAAPAPAINPLAAPTPPPDALRSALLPGPQPASMRPPPAPPQPASTPAPLASGGAAPGTTFPTHASAVGLPEFRTWTDSTGKFRIEAQLTAYGGEKATLKKRGGQTLVLALAQLSETDQAYVRATMPAHGAVGKTELAGGQQGWEFRHEGPGPLLGIRYALGSWDNEKTVGKVDAVFDRYATADPQTTVVARDGYAVGAMNVDAERFVNAIQIVFMRLGSDGRLDPSDNYASEWIGFPTGRPPKTLGGTGAEVIGVCGRRGAILDAVGLICRGR